MRINHVTVVICIAASAHGAFAADRCQQISDIVAQAAVMKPKLVEQLKKAPQKGTLGEPWRHFAFVLGSDLEKLRVPPDEQQYIFKTVATLHFASKPRWISTSSASTSTSVASARNADSLPCLSHLFPPHR